MSYFLNTDEIVQTIRMIEQEHLDVRTITLGLSLLDCATGDIKRTADKVYEKICPSHPWRSLRAGAARTLSPLPRQWTAPRARSA